MTAGTILIAVGAFLLFMFGVLLVATKLAHSGRGHGHARHPKLPQDEPIREVSVPYDYEEFHDFEEDV